MRKGRNGGNGGKNGKRQMKIVATMSLPAVNHPNNTARMTTAGMPHARAKKGICTSTRHPVVHRGYFIPNSNRVPLVVCAKTYSKQTQLYLRLCQVEAELDLFIK